ncbi:hypothetical protein ACWC6I_09165 [Streptomyces sp. NPDC001414]
MGADGEGVAGGHQDAPLRERVRDLVGTLVRLRAEPHHVGDGVGGDVQAGQSGVGDALPGGRVLAAVLLQTADRAVGEPSGGGSRDDPWRPPGHRTKDQPKRAESGVDTGRRGQRDPPLAASVAGGPERALREIVRRGQALTRRIEEFP